MKTKILIDGETSACFELQRKIPGRVVPALFGYEVHFRTKKEARAALNSAYKNLKAELKDQYETATGVRYQRANGRLFYDSARAIISTFYN